jgi:hypothetical protein
MKSKPVLRLACAISGVVLACLVLLCSFASFSPSLHEIVHADAKSADHFCHLALWGKGDLLASTPPDVRAHLPSEVLLPPLEPQSFFSLPDLLSFPTRGPPALS